MSEEPSGSHPRAPREDESATFKLPRAWLGALIAGLLGSGITGGGITLFGGGREATAHTELVQSLADIKTQLVLMNSKLDTTATRIEDHEKRIRDLEAAAKR